MESIEEKTKLAKGDGMHINGHSPEYVARHMGVSLKELFPSNGRCAYIGDPFQRLDLPGVTIFEFEYGPVVLFRRTIEAVNEPLESQLERAFWTVRGEEQIDDDDAKYLRSIQEEVRNLVGKVKTTKLKDLPSLSSEFTKFRQKIEEKIKTYAEVIDREDMSKYEEGVRSLWYLAVEGERVADVYTYETAIKPELDKFTKDLDSSLSSTEREKQIKDKERELIEIHRLKKTTKHADVVQAIFPQLPVADHSFDRLVAFWSISTYVFPYMNFDDFMTYWKEIDRVLSDNGVAYIGPFFETPSDIYAGEWDEFNENVIDDPLMMSIKAAIDLGLEIEEEEMGDHSPERGRSMLVVRRIKGK